MLGYITVNKEELKIREYREYHSYYCGLCRALQRQYGNPARLTLTYDMTFLVLLLTGLYEPETGISKQHCGLHFGKKEEVRQNLYSEYAADMNILLAYYDLLDDWKDEKKAGKLALAKLLEKAYHRMESKYPRQNRAVLTYIERLRACEAESENNPDLAAGYTGQLLGEIFVWKEDEWKETLYQLGHALGKFIYLMDAYEDMEADEKMGNYNPFLLYFREKGSLGEDREQNCYQVLRLIMADAAREFERLPILQNGEIIRNILYSGVWMNYERVRQQRMRGISEE